MKKIFVGLILSISLVCMGLKDVWASSVHDIPQKQNYLSLSNLMVTDPNGYYGRTIDPITIVSDTLFTLVFDESYLGQNFEYASMIEIEIIGYPGGIIQYYEMIVDEIGRRSYIEFEIASDQIELINIPTPTSQDYHAMLYEGTYLDFPGFQPYLPVSEIMSYHGFLPVDYDQLLTQTDIESLIGAHDGYGSPISYQLIHDTYNTGNKLPGTYQMIYQVTAHEITKKLFLDIRVFDLSAPVLTIPSLLEIPLAEKWSMAEILDQITVFDNVDLLTTDDLVITSDTYTDAINVGSYEITLEVTDSSGNTTTETMSINLVDANPPVIEGPINIFVYTTDTPLSNQEILDRYQATDDVNGQNVIFMVSLNAYNQTTTPGIYQITLSATDMQSNTSFRHIFIHVIENKGPEFEMDEAILETSVAQSMTDEEIIAWFTSQATSTGLSISNVKVLYSEYASNETSTGNYYVYLSYDLDDRNMTSRIMVEVHEADMPIWTYPAIGGSSLIILLGVIWIIKKKKKP